MGQSFKTYLVSALLTACLVLAVIFYYKQVDRSFPYKFNSQQILLQLKTQSSSSHNQHMVYNLKAGDVEGDIVFNTVNDKVTGQSMVDANLFGVNSTFQNRPAPYPGQITAVLVCNTQKYLQQSQFLLNGAPTQLILAVANDRRIFGICLIEDVKFASLFWSAYDEQKKLVITLRLFKSVANEAQITTAQQDLLKVLQNLVIAQ